MRDDNAARIVPLGPQQILQAEYLVHHAGPRPQDHRPAGYLGEVPPQVLIGNEEDFLVGRNPLDDLARVAAGDDPIAQALHRRRRVDVRHRREPPPLVAQRLLVRRQLLRRAALGQRAARQQVGKQHALLGVEDLGRFRHEVHTGEHDGRLRDPRGVARQLQAVAREIGDILNLAVDVIVRQQNCVVLLLEPLDVIHQFERVVCQVGCRRCRCQGCHATQSRSREPALVVASSYYRSVRHLQKPMAAPRARRRLRSGQMWRMMMARLVRLGWPADQHTARWVPLREYTLASMAGATAFDPYALPAEAVREPPESLWAAFRQIGPGIILAGSIVGSGELILTTSLGADWGFMFLWLILFSCVIKVFVQIELGRTAISMGKPTLGILNDLPGFRVGAHWLVWWWFFMLLATVVQLGAMVGGVGQALHLAFPAVSTELVERFHGQATALGRLLSEHPEHPWAALTALAAVALLLSGGYKLIERATTAMVAAVTLITAACVCALPYTGFPINFSEVARGLSINFPADAQQRAKAIAAAFAVFGITGVGASELYSYPYWCLEKGYGRFVGVRSDDAAWVRRANGWIRVMHLDAWVSMVVFTVATVAFYFLGATVLHSQDLHPKGPRMIATLSEMYVPAFGDWTKILFLIGAWAVLFKTLYVASAGHSRLTTDFFGLAGWLQIPNAAARARMIRALCFFYPSMALVLYLSFGEPQGMVKFGGLAQGVTLPVITGAAVYLRYRKTDGRIAPSRLSDLCLWVAFALISAVAVKAIWDNLSVLAGG